LKIHPEVAPLSRQASLLSALPPCSSTFPPTSGFWPKFNFDICTLI
jgi:hypothetical protein